MAITSTRRATLREVVADAPYGRAQLARRANLSRTTTLAMAGDQSRARIDTIRELALALGYDVSIELERASDPLAAAAARVILGDFDIDSRHPEHAEHADLEKWIARLHRYSDGEPASVVSEAARVSGAQYRSGAILLDGRVDADRLVSVGRASEAQWALSGSASLEALGGDPGAVVVFWTEDARRVGELLAETHRRVRVLSAADLIVAPAHPSVFEGSITVDDVSLVSPVQGMIDAMASGGVDRQLAETVVRSW